MMAPYDGLALRKRTPVSARTPAPDVGERFGRMRENGERSQFTFMVYLNDGFGGGGTSFADPRRRLFDAFTVVPKKGSALFFYHHLDHRGDEVTSGRKYVLRSDVMYSPHWTDKRTQEKIRQD